MATPVSPATLPLPTAPPIPLDSKLGAAFLGNLIAAVLFGVTCVQAYTYFTKQNTHDHRWFKALIAFLWVLDVVHLSFVTHGLYYYLISKYGVILAIMKPTWSILGQIYVTILSDGIIRIVFARRVWIVMQRNYWLIGSIGVTTLASFISGLGFASEGFIYMTYESFQTFSYFLYLAFGAGSAADILIAAALCYNLSKRRTGFKKTDTLVNVLMMYTINTSVLTTICTAATLITYSIWPNEFTFIGIYFSLSKLFLNSLLATLNNRESLQEKLRGVSENSGNNYPTNGIEIPTRNGGKFNQSLLVSINREVVNDIELGEKDTKIPVGIP